MSFPRLLISVFKTVFSSVTPNRCLMEGLLKYDFKCEEPRKHVMQISFSALASWPLFILIFMIWFDPFRYSWSLNSIFGEGSEFRFFLLDGQVSVMILFALLFFCLEWFIRNEYVFIAIVFYFLAKSELHLHLALASVIGVYFSKACYLCRLSLSLQSKTKRIWIWVTTLQLIATVSVSIASLLILDQTWPRFYFLACVIFIVQFAIFSMAAVWGHFYFKIKNDPAFIPIYFSTATWLKKMKLSSDCKQQLRRVTQNQINIHHASLRQLQEMKDQSLGVRLGSIEVILNKELAYLRSAASRLTIE